MRVILSSILCLCLSACGFHLSQREKLPEEFTDVYLASNNAHTPIYSMLKQTFKVDGVDLAESPQDASIIFHVLTDKESTSSTSTGSTQETRVYQLIYTFSFQLENTKGKPVYGPITLSNSMNDFVYAGQVIGNNQELPPSYKKLREKTIQQMLLLLSSDNVKEVLNENKPRTAS
jgi:outer membrane lipopolysaccharide assembly protein LptE/RlpB